MHKRKIVAMVLVIVFAFPAIAWGQTIKSEKKSKEVEIQEIVSLTPNSPVIKARGAVLMDASSGQVLYGININTPLPEASTTKILTAIIAIENSKPDDVVTISEDATRVGGTHIAMQTGEHITMNDLLYALLLNSSNDAAVAIADQISGSTEKFAKLMNEKAKELGAQNSNFVNPNGLPEKKHYTTAYDLALITRYAMKNSTFRKIVGTPSYEIKREKPNAQKNFYNHNKLIQPFSIYRYKGAIGVKTGYTIEARQCIVGAANRDNRELIAVVLGTEAIWEGPTKLLDYGFNYFHSVNVTEAGEFVKREPVKYGSDQVKLVTKDKFSFSLPNGENKTPNRNIIINPQIKAPIKIGQKLGRIDYYYKNQKVGSVDLVAQNKVERKPLIHKSAATKAIAIIGGVVLVLLLAINRYNSYKRRRRRLKKLNRI